MKQGTDDFLSKRRAYSKRRLRATAVALKRSAPPVPNLAVYVTGSFGRLEGSQSSDLDVFFVLDDSSDPPPPMADQTLVRAALIRIARRMEFPEFSNDLQYLQTLSLKDMLQDLGGPRDDYENYFTARLLLLLESRPLYNTPAYSRIIEQIARLYLRDRGGHESAFHPVFLLNDIIRYWKTLLLNYEHKRHDTFANEETKAKYRVINFKLGFSRMLTCFSMVLPLAAKETTSIDEILQLCKATPLERLHTIVKTRDDRALLSSIRLRYEWFLEEVSVPQVIRHNLEDNDYKRSADQAGESFADDMFKLLISTAHPSMIRYVVI